MVMFGFLGLNVSATGMAISRRGNNDHDEMTPEETTELRQVADETVIHTDRS